MVRGEDGVQLDAKFSLEDGETWDLLHIVYKYLVFNLSIFVRI